jgi:multimeric flavodoxin WrbA
MKALAICGSPRTNGNTEQMLQRCLDRLAKEGMETRLARLSELRVEPCRACGACRETRNMACAMDGDDFGPLFTAMREADIILVGSPVYFGSATPQIMALLDRAGYVSMANGGVFTRKLGGPVAVARRAGQNATYAQLLMWFMINGMVVPGSTYWAIAIGRQPGDVQQDAEALRTLDGLSDNLAWLSARLVEA